MSEIKVSEIPTFYCIPKGVYFEIFFCTIVLHIRTISYMDKGADIINGEYPPGVFFKGSQIFGQKNKGSQIFTRKLGVSN